LNKEEQLRAKIVRIYDLLRSAYGEPQRTGRVDPIGELVGVIISQHTSDVNTDRAYENLVQTFGSWEAVRDAPVAAIANAIKTAGLSNVKAPRLKAVLQTISSRYGRLDISHLASLPLAQAKAELRSLPGVGPKTAACTLLFALDLPAFPVDTHIYRVARRIGLIDDRVGPDAAHDVLEPLIPPDKVFGFHILMIRHGRVTCRARDPRCPECVVLHECAYGRRALGIPE
jgi:endonuclease-3